MKENNKYMICPDDNILAQFIEGTLDASNEDVVLMHLDHCKKCYNIVLTALEFEETNSQQHNEANNSVKIFNEIPKYHAAGKNNDSVKKRALQTEENKMPRQSLDENNSCAIKVQQFILKEFGKDISENELIEEAQKERWFVQGKGMLLEHVGKTLIKHGISIKTMLQANEQDILIALREGSKVIVGVDSGELWSDTIEELLNEKAEDLIEEIPDHVVLVEGVTIEGGKITRVIIRDPEISDKVQEVSPDIFMDAWKDSQYFMIKTIHPKH
jgi:hypothetical protein